MSKALKNIFLVALTSMILVVSGSIGITSFNNDPFLVEGAANDKRINPVIPKIAAPHSAFEILNEIELAAFISAEGFSGDGTPATPYIIEDLEISDLATTKFAGIYLEDIQSHLILRNLQISDISSPLEYFMGIWLRNCSNIQLETISIVNLINTNYTDWGSIYGFYLYECENVTLSSSTISSTSAPTNIDCFIGNSHSITVDQLSTNDILSINNSQGISCYDSEKIEISSCNFSSRSVDEMYALTSNMMMGLNFGTTCSDVIVENCQFENFTSNGIIRCVNFFIASDILIQNCLWKNFTGNFIGSYLNDVTQIYFRDNQFQNFNAITEAVIVWAASNVAECEFTGNNLQKMEAPLLTFFQFNDGISNIIRKNVMQGEIDSPNGKFAYFSSGTHDNEIYYNYIFNASSYIAMDWGTDNIWSQMTYFEPMGALTTVGNYWCDHNMDTEGSFHYFVSTPRPIFGDANASDTHPLHYFGFDFDEDGLSNYEEIYGVLGDEATTEGSEASFWEKLISDPGALFQLPIILLLLVLVVKPKKKEQ